MFDFIFGRVAYIYDEYVALELNGLGYKVYTPSPHKFGIGDSVRLFIFQVVREDAQLLYGFLTTEEREFFEMILGVSGIGPKTALYVLSIGSPALFIQAINTEDLDQLTSVPGIGKKTAQRLILELRDKLRKSSLIGKFLLTDSGLVHQLNGSQNDVLEALIALGYTDQESRNMVKKAVDNCESREVNDLLRAALSAR